jgi:hypothetical protein
MANSSPLPKATLTTLAALMILVSLTGLVAITWWSTPAQPPPALPSPTLPQTAIGLTTTATPSHIPSLTPTPHSASTVAPPTVYPSATPVPSMVPRPTNTERPSTTVRVSPVSQVVKVGQAAVVEVRVDWVRGLYGVELGLTFDEARLQAVDTDGNAANGIQPSPGTLLNPMHGAISWNWADNSTGQVSFAVSLSPPAPAVDGSGVLLTVAFVARAQGTAMIRLDQVILRGVQAEPLGASVSHGIILVQAVPTPTVWPTGTSTETPSATPPTPSITPWPTPTWLPTATAIPWPSATALPTTSATPSPTASDVPSATTTQTISSTPMPSATAVPSPTSPSEQTALVLVHPSSAFVAVNGSLTLDIRIEHVVDLYAFDVEIAFDPARVEVVDADGNPENGVQLTFGEFLDVAQGFSIINSADNATGRAQALLSLMFPAQPVSGSGRLARITFRGKSPGVSSVRLSAVTLSNHRVQSIPASVTHGTLAVIAVPAP